MSQFLTPDELQRANRRLTADLRKRAIASRAILRRLLGHVCGLTPWSVAIVTDDNEGKPALSNGDFAFNVAHAEDVMLVAITREGAVGVDIESLTRAVDVERIAARYFAPAEIEEVAARVGADRKAHFLRIWTRKEAYAKARGDGLRLDFATFDLSDSALRSAGQLRPLGDPADAPGWRFVDLVPGSGFIGALAYSGNGVKISTWQLPEHWWLVPAR